MLCGGDGGLDELPGPQEGADLERNLRLASSSALFMHTWAATRAGRCAVEMAAMKPAWVAIGAGHVAPMRPEAAEKRAIMASVATAREKLLWMVVDSAQMLWMVCGPHRGHAKAAQQEGFSSNR